MRVLAFTTIFPNAGNPKYAPYTLQQSIELAKLCDLRVWATLPWFPGERLLSRWNYWNLDPSKIPAVEAINGLTVEHPRFLRIPKLGLPVAGGAYAASLLPRLLPRAARPDVIYATWAYPDGAAALLLGRLLQVPAVVQVIGSDVNIIAGKPTVKAQLSRLLPSAAGVVAVSDPLAEQMKALGAPPARVHTICTGLDLERFRPRDKAEARRKQGVTPTTKLILYVGRLFREKGVVDLLDAFEQLAGERDDLRLVIVGDGPARRDCEARRDALGDRLTLTGELEPDAVADWVAACDVLTLPSWSEGTPNVVLEALGSGRPVVATRVGGIPSVVRHAVQGELVEPQNPNALARALLRVATAPGDPWEIRERSDLFTWAENARRVSSVLEQAQRLGPAVLG